MLIQIGECHAHLHFDPTHIDLNTHKLLHGSVGHLLQAEGSKGVEEWLLLSLPLG